MGLFKKIFKGIGSVLGGPAAGAAIDIGGNILNALGNKNTNDANLQIAQMNNDWNYKMMQEQMAYNTEMWNKENEYNSPVNKVKRLQEAGLNPYLALEGAGTAGSAGSVTPAQAQAVTMQAPHYDFSQSSAMMQKMFENSMQKQMTEAQVNLMQIDAQTRAMRNLADLHKVISETDNNRLKNEYQRISNAWANNMQSAEFRLKMNQAKSYEEEAKQKSVQTAIYSKELATFDERFRADLGAKLADAALARAAAATHGTQQRLNKAQFARIVNETKAIAVNMIKTQAETQGIKISNKLAEETAEATAYRICRESLYGNSVSDVLSVGMGLIRDGIGGIGSAFD